jgi:hypothetical protein
MGKNQFSEFENKWTNVQWEGYISMNSFALKKVHELPDFIQDNGLTDKFNSALIVASASTTHEFYGVIGYRPDEDNTVVDEHAFVYIRNIEENSWKGGILHHANYQGRTTNLPLDITEALNVSGVTASISLERAPEEPYGSLGYLEENNILSGVSANFYIAINKTNE